MKKLDQPEHHDYDDVPLVYAVAFVILFTVFCISLTMLAFY